MKYLFSLLLLCQIIGLSAKERVDSILSVLDSEIEHREIYYQQKEKEVRRHQTAIPIRQEPAGKV